MERPQGTEITQIRLGDRPYAVQGPVGWEYSNIFGRKQNQGDPEPDDHPVFTTSIQSDWSRGGMVKFGRPANDQQRFWWSTCETQYPNALSLPPKTFSYDSPAGETADVWCLGDFNERLYVAYGSLIYKRNLVSGVMTPITTMSGSATKKGVVYREQLSPFALHMYVPHSAGYATIDSLDVVANGTDTNPVIDFAVWDDKLFKLMGDGSVYWCLKRPTVAADWNLVAWVPDGSRPRRLTPYMTRNGEPVLMVITDGSTWKLDFANSMLHKDDLEFPRHPDQGLAAVNHKGDLIVSVGTGAHRFDNNTISSFGLDERDGLPQEFRGKIVDFASGYNGLYALIQGESMMDVSAPWTADIMTGPGDMGFVGPPAESHNLLMIQNGFGWHYRWHNHGDTPTNLVISNVQNQYMLFWGCGPTLNMQVLPRTYFNPADADTRGYAFAHTATHITYWNAWGWEGQDKIAKQVELSARKLGPGDSIEVQFQVEDEDHPPVSLGTITADGEYRFYLGLDPLEPVLKGGVKKYKGIRHERYRLIFIFTGANDWSSPYIRWHSTIARRWLRPQRTWRLTLDMTDRVQDHTIEQQKDHLFEMSLAQEAVVFEHGEKKYMVEVSLANGPESTGRDIGTMASITLVEANDLDRFGQP